MDKGGASSAGGGGRNNARTRKSKKNRSRRRDNNSRRSTGGGGGKRGARRGKGAPAPPQTKILIRNIGDATKHGSVEGMVGLIRSFLDGANQKLLSLTSRIVQLHEASTAGLIRGAEAVKKAQEEANTKNSDANEIVENYGDAQIGEDAVTEEEEKPVNVLPRISEKSDGSLQDATSVALSMAENSTTNFGARIVYIVPPKQTRRRGVKPGCAYLLISGPRIEAKEPPPRPSSTAAMTIDSSHSEEKKDLTEVGDKNGESIKEPATQDNNEPHEPKENHVVIVDPSEKNATAAATTSHAVDYSREVAQGRYLVTQAIELLEEYAKEDAKSEQRYAGSMVEVALSGKTYKQNLHRRDRREGTLEQSADYKIFLDKAAKDKEERMARPKPAPGGGVSVIAAATSETAESGQPIAALVEHIRSKRAEASKRKKAKKKSKDTTGKEKGNNERSRGSRKKKSKEQGTNEEGGRKGGRRKEGTKGKRRDKKKNGTAERVAPTALLKSVAATSGTTAATQQRAAPLTAANGHG
jgi:hypothetical protein